MAHWRPKSGSLCSRSSRHTIGTNAILLGPIHVGDHAKIGANAFVINHDVPPSATVVGTPARIVKLNGEGTDQELPRMASSPGAEAVNLEV
jgi:serine O-acetyltransferase